MDNELLLYDRIQVIQATNQKYDLEHNAYLSFSGGKDSTILHHLLDMALPNNKIPRVFIDTGIEYTMIREFVMKQSIENKRLKINSKWIAYDEVLDFLKWQFDEDFADQQINLFHVVKGKINVSKRNKQR